MACLYGGILAISHPPLITLIVPSLPLSLNQWFQIKPQISHTCMHSLLWTPTFLRRHCPASSDIPQVYVHPCPLCHFASYPCFHPLIVLFSFLSFFCSLHLWLFCANNECLTVRYFFLIYIWAYVHLYIYSIYII